MNLLRSILSEAWAIDENYAIQMMPFVSSVISGGTINPESIVVKKPVQFASIDAKGISFSNSSDASSSEGVVAVLPIHDVLLKYDAFCGPIGMKTMEQLLIQWDENPDVVGIVLDIDSPGGQASYLPNIAETIKGLKTPIISFYSGTCASAAYYIASQTNEIFASAETDQVGSIGTMLSFATPHPDQKDFVLHTIYATKSTDKNKPFEDAIKGEYDLLRTSLLDPFNESFHGAVRSSRTEIDDSVFSGSTYTTQKAIELKLIDGQMVNLKEAISHVFSLGKAKSKSNNNQTTNSEMKKLERISAILGKDVTAETVLTAAELEMIENHSNQPEPEATNTAPTAEEITASLSGSIQEAVNAAVAPLQGTITSLQERLAQVEGSPAAEATTAAPVSGEAKTFESQPWLDPNNSLNKAAQEALKS